MEEDFCRVHVRQHLQDTVSISVELDQTNLLHDLDLTTFGMVIELGNEIKGLLVPSDSLNLKLFLLQ